MTPDHINWHLLQHGKLSQKAKLDVIRSLDGDLSLLPDRGLEDLDPEVAASLRESFDRAANEAFVLEELANQGMHLLVGRDDRYPVRLKRRLGVKTPLVLYAAGEPELLNAPRTVAIIGARDAGDIALELTERAAAFFAREGYVVVSGYARGVDRVAFNATLAAGGNTVAVLPQGMLDKSTASAIRKNVQHMSQERLLFISELHPNATWQARFAMMRNRLITALADFVVVAQSGPKESIKNGKKRMSGTWRGAEIAHKQGRRVFVFDLPVEGNQALAAAFATLIPPTPDAQMFFDIEDALAQTPAPQATAEAPFVVEQPSLFS